MEGILRDDLQKAEEVWEDIHAVPPMLPRDEFSHFPEYNAQVEKVRLNASGYVNACPPRAPYRDLPEHWRKLAKAHGKAWAELRERYIKAPAAG